MTGTWIGIQQVWSQDSFGQIRHDWLSWRLEHSPFDAQLIMHHVLLFDDIIGSRNRIWLSLLCCAVHMQIHSVHSWA